jgi:hypothetical protein
VKNSTGQNLYNTFIHKGLSLFLNNFCGFKVYFKFIGKSNVDYWFSGKEIKTNNISVFVEFKVVASTFPVIIDVPFSPVKTSLSEGLKKDSVDSFYLDGSESFMLGKGKYVESSPMVYYVNILGNEPNKRVSKKVIKYFSDDQWKIIMNLGKDQLILDFKYLKNLVRIEMNTWRDQVLQEIVKEIDLRVNELENPGVDWPNVVGELIKGVIAATTSEFPVVGAVLSFAVTIGQEAYNWANQPGDAKDIIESKFDELKDKSQDLSKEISDYLNKLIKENSQAKTTEDIEHIVLEDLQKTLPSPREMIKS